MNAYDSPTDATTAGPSQNESVPLRLAIVGTGGIGQLHARLAAEMASVDLVGLSGLDDQANALAQQVGCPLFGDYRRLLEVDPEAVIVATPNETHLEIASFFAQSGVDLLVEKPIAESLVAARQLCTAASDAGVQLLVGHHRRHHSLVKTAKAFVESHLGQLVATNTLVTMRKPDSYYDVEWRRGKAAGPLLVNLIHEVDLLRAVCGEITHVQAVGSKIGRNFEFDDTAAMIFQFDSGAVGTLAISESTPSPWSWEASVSDGMGFHNAGQDHLKFIGTQASLSFPSLTAWRYETTTADPGWQSPLLASRLDQLHTNPYINQIEHLVELSRGNVEPLVSGEDGLRSLAVVDAVMIAAQSGQTINVAKLVADI